MEKPSVKLTSHLVLTACLSAGITGVLSVTYIVLSTLALVYRSQCSYGDVTLGDGAEYFWKTIFSAYILERECAESQQALEQVNGALTEEFTLFVLTISTLSASAICLITALLLTTVVLVQNGVEYVHLSVVSYVASCVISLVVDLTAAVYYGLDYSYITSLLESLPAGIGSNFNLEVLRQAAFWMMTISLKGYVALAINIILLVLLLVYLAEARQLAKTGDHSIHKLGALSAYDQPRKPVDNWLTPTDSTLKYSRSQPRKPEDSWTNQPDSTSSFSRGPQYNNAYVEETSLPRTPRRNPSQRSDYPQRNDYGSNRQYERIDSWNNQSTNASLNARPFSYLEEIKRPVPIRPPVSPVVEAPWRREGWPPSPVVPAPDYSPHGPRRLKSALKPAY